MTDSYAFFAPGTPTPQGSKNAYRRGDKIVLVESAGKALKKWRDGVAAVARELKLRPIEGAVEITITFVMPRTKAMRDKPAPPMTQRPDIDKLARSTFDALTDIAWRDDSQVVSALLHKRRADFGEETGAWITIQEYTPES